MTDEITSQGKASKHHDELRRSLKRCSDFESIAEWMEENCHFFWRQAVFINKHKITRAKLPNNFRLWGVEFKNMKWNTRIYTPPSINPFLLASEYRSKTSEYHPGWKGEMHFNVTGVRRYPIVDMFKDTGIETYAVRKLYGNTHTTNVSFIADQWNVMTMYAKLSETIPIFQD
jgi:hypothetical protein